MPTLNTGQWTTSSTSIVAPNIIAATLSTNNGNSSITLGRQTIDESAAAEFYNAARLLKALMQRSKLVVIAPDTALEDRYRDLRNHFENWLYAIADDRPVEECNALAERYTQLRDMYTTYEAVSEK